MLEGGTKLAQAPPFSNARSYACSHNPRPVRRLDGAGDGARTHDIQLGKLTVEWARCPLMSAIKARCPLMSVGEGLSGACPTDTGGH